MKSGPDDYISIKESVNVLSWCSKDANYCGIRKKTEKLKCLKNNKPVSERVGRKYL